MQGDGSARPSGNRPPCGHGGLGSRCGLDAGSTILAALDSRGLTPAVNRASAAGVPVILVDLGVEDADVVTIIRTDNVRASGLAADYAAALPSYSGKVAQIEGEIASETAQLRA